MQDVALLRLYHTDFSIRSNDTIRMTLSLKTCKLKGCTCDGHDESGAHQEPLGSNESWDTSPNNGAKCKCGGRPGFRHKCKLCCERWKCPKCRRSHKCGGDDNATATTSEKIDENGDGEKACIVKDGKDTADATTTSMPSEIPPEWVIPTYAIGHAWIIRFQWGTLIIELLNILRCVHHQEQAADTSSS